MGNQNRLIFIPMRLKYTLNERKYYVTYNRGRGQGKGLEKEFDQKTFSSTDKPKVFSSYSDAKKYAEKMEKMFRNSIGGGTAYWVSDEKMNPIKESVNEEDTKSPEEILRGLKEMAMGDLERIEDYAEMISDRMKEGQELSSWMYSQITLAVDQLNSVHDAMDGKDGVKESVNEVSKKIPLFIPNVGNIDDFKLKSLLQKNPRVKNILGDKEFKFLNQDNTDVIMVSGKPYNSITTDGELEFELDLKKNILVKPLSKARPKIVAHYSQNESVNEGAGTLTIEKRKDGKYYWQYKFKSGKKEDWPEGFNTKADAQKDFMYRSKYIKEVVNEGRAVKAIQSDFNKTVAAIETELLHYKKTKGTPQEKKHVDNLKKLHPIKKKLEAELESAVSGLYRDAELKIED
jgi:hypothetical protein